MAGPTPFPAGGGGGGGGPGRGAGGGYPADEDRRAGGLPPPFPPGAFPPARGGDYGPGPDRLGPGPDRFAQEALGMEKRRRF